VPKIKLIFAQYLCDSCAIIKYMAGNARNTAEELRNKSKIAVKIYRK